MKNKKARFKKNLLLAFLLSAVIPLSGAKSKTPALVVDSYTEKDITCDDSFNIDGLSTYVIQGICLIDDYKLITAYDSSAENKNSIVYIYKDDEFQGSTTLYNNAHVGGIAYDMDHELIWITDIHGTISAYNKDDILGYNTNVEPTFKQVNVGDDLINFYGNNAAAYITINEGKLYVGNFSQLSNAIVKEFKIKNDGSLDTETEVSRKFPRCVQGMTFLTKGDNKYLLLSTSWGWIKKSELKIYKYDEDNFDYANTKYISITLPPMMEQIAIDDNNNLITIFESNAKKYPTPLYENDDVYTLLVDDVLEHSTKKL